jgi:hypothetical protein
MKYFIPLFFISMPFFAKAQIGEIPPSGDSTTSPWSFAASGYYYILPGLTNTLTLIGTADYKSIHLEPRYNYEGEHTGSVFAGWKFEAKGKIELTVTPMAGIVFGDLHGAAPGLELEVAYQLFDFYSESEYLIDFEDHQSNYFYTWTELGISPFHSFRTGISAQRTRLYQTGLDLQRGVFAEYAFWKLTVGVHYFNPFTTDYFFITSLNFAL